MKKFILKFVLFLLVLACGMEVFFRTVLPACSLPRNRQDTASQVLQFDPDWRREGRKTIGRFCEEQGRWHINNAGWNSPFEYRQIKTPGVVRVAVIGNSNIAGFALDVDRHLDTRLNELLGKTGEVFAFGMQGAPMSQYIGMAQYTEATFNPDVYLIFVGNEGVKGSLGRPSPYRYCVEQGEQGFVLESPTAIYRPNPLGQILYRSALYRYLVFNRAFRAKGELGGVMGLEAAVQRASIPVDSPTRELASFLLDELRNKLPEDRIILFTDALRKRIYKGESAELSTIDYRVLAAAHPEEWGIELLDLSSAMKESFRKDGIRFESSKDPHWNAHGHDVVARALHDYLIRNRGLEY